MDLWPQRPSSALQTAAGSFRNELSRSAALQYCKKFCDTWTGRACRPPGEFHPPPPVSNLTLVMKVADGARFRNPRLVLGTTLGKRVPWPSLVSRDAP